MLLVLFCVHVNPLCTLYLYSFFVVVYRGPYGRLAFLSLNVLPSENKDYDYYYYYYYSIPFRALENTGHRKTQVKYICTRLPSVYFFCFPKLTFQHMLIPFKVSVCLM